MDVDVIVVGAGPGGSTAARELAQRGKSVLLLDRARFPRDKPCGGGVTIRCAELLPFDISPVVEHVVTGAQIRRGHRRNVRRNYEGVLTYMTQRRRLDAFLVERAQEAGVEFRDGQAVTGVQQLPNGDYEVRVGGSGGTGGMGGEVHVARALVGADGANGVVKTALGFEHPRESAVALEGNIAMPNGMPSWLEGRVALQLGLMPGGYGWVFPKGDHVNVGVGGWKAIAGPHLRESLHTLCRDYGFDPASMTGLRGHHLPMARPGAVLAAGGAALVGDAAGFVDPLSGEGIYGAISSGVAVAPAVDDYVSRRTATLAAYEDHLRRELIPDLVASHALMDIFHAWPAPWVWLMQHSDRFFLRFCGILLGTETLDHLVRSFGPLTPFLHPAARAGRAITTRRWGDRFAS